VGNLPNVLSADLHPSRATTSRATNTDAQKTSGQTNPRARLHQGEADLCAGGAPAYSRFIPPGGPSRPWQLIRNQRSFQPKTPPDPCQVAICPTRASSLPGSVATSRWPGADGSRQPLTVISLPETKDERSTTLPLTRFPSVQVSIAHVPFGRLV
jgi:hypothetical protein